MRLPPRIRQMKRPGFTLTELVIAGALSGLVFMALLAVQKSVLFSQQNEWRARKLTVDSLYALEAIKSSLRLASIIVEPELNGASDRLFGYSNVNPQDHSKLVQSEPQEYFLYCFDSTHGTLYKYQGRYPPAQTFLPFYCGKPPEETQNREILAGNMEAAAVTYLFSRSQSNSNIVNITYRLSYNTQKVEGYTAASIQKSL